MRQVQHKSGMVEWVLSWQGRGIFYFNLSQLVHMGCKLTERFPSISQFQEQIIMEHISWFQAWGTFDKERSDFKSRRKYHCEVCKAMSRITFWIAFASFPPVCSCPFFDTVSRPALLRFYPRQSIIIWAGSVKLLFFNKGLLRLVFDDGKYQQKTQQNMVCQNKM